uniref:NADH:ubiquinone reductase (H(+)-translocating) n=1 Tax=Prosevania sp. ZJUH_2016031 TaxID=2491170 RepID=A0A3Q8UAC4_9HYME|nr:NADH dehydrogenase subunit 5 [Prosevania sp. ZJUH_2016031]
MMFLVLSFFFFFFGLVSLMIFFFLIFVKESIVFFFEFLFLNSIKFEFMFFLDWISLCFISVVFIIFSMILIFSYEYMGFDFFKLRFIYLLTFFVVSMVFMILSPNLISVMLGWDGLGIISYCLIIYYQNNVSYISGMITVMMNRVGDVFMLILIGIYMLNGSWNILLTYFCQFLMFFTIVCLTKSAQYPFSIWLPLAMAAPTPVSALVHSSTLVTAGIYLMLRGYVLLSNFVLSVILLISLFTMFFSGLMANFENDLKKVVALSTLSQLGLMMFVLSSGEKILCFFHLVNHAFFKSLLFMCVGYLMFMGLGYQDLRVLGLLSSVNKYLSIFMVYSVLSMSGLFFLSGFYSKDLILEKFFYVNMSYFTLVGFYVSCLLTVSYSFRLIFILLKNNLILSLMNLGESYFMIFSMVILWILSLLSGFYMNWFFFIEIFVLNYFNKFIIFLVFILGILFSLVLNFFSLNNLFFYFLGSMFYLDYFYIFLINFPLIYLYEYNNYLNLGVDNYFSGILFKMIFKDVLIFLKSLDLGKVYLILFFLLIFLL